MTVDFYQAELPPGAFDVGAMMERMKCSKEVAQKMVNFNRSQMIVMNDRYQVNIRKVDPTEDWPSMIHLSIKRIDKEPIHDWRELQAIKTSILGPEAEAMELYPAESRVIDTANQYHLWAFADLGQALPFGFFDGRNVSGPEEAEMVGAKQRPFQPLKP